MRYEIDELRDEMVIRAGKSDISFLEELRELTELVALDEIIEELLYVALVSPKAVGASEGAPVFVDLATGASPEETLNPDDYGKVYWFPAYKQQSIIEVLATDGEVRLPRITIE